MRLTSVLVLIVFAASAKAAETPLEMANRGAQLYVSGNYPEAESYYRRALTSWPPEGQQGRAILLNNLGELLRVTGRYSEAELTINQALEIAEHIGPQASPEIVAALDNLAVIYRTRGELEKAEAVALRAAPLASDAERASNRLVLASIYAEEGAFERAKPLLQDGLESTDARTSLTAAIILSTAAFAQRDFPAAEGYARRALDLANRNLPKCHPATAMALNNLAEACRMQGQFLEAEKRYREAIAVWENSVGRDHPDLAKGLLGLALLYHERQREAGAETLARRAIAMLEHFYGESAPQLAGARRQLATILRAEGRVTEARRLDGTN